MKFYGAYDISYMIYIKQDGRTVNPCLKGQFCGRLINKRQELNTTQLTAYHIRDNFSVLYCQLCKSSILNMK